MNNQQKFLSVEPPELKFSFKLRKKLSSSLRLSNTTDQHVAFKVKTNYPNKYCVEPNRGIFPPRSICDVIVTMRPQKVFPADEHDCKDKFLIQSVIVDDSSQVEDITSKTFSKKPSDNVQECKLSVVYDLQPEELFSLDLSDESSRDISLSGTHEAPTSSTTHEEKKNDNNRKYHLIIEPLELKFTNLEKQISCPIQLSNPTKEHIAFKVKATNPRKYCVRPNIGICLPDSTCDVNVIMQSQKKSTPGLECKDKFLIQMIIVKPETELEGITAEMFSRELGNVVEQCRLRVLNDSQSRSSSLRLKDHEDSSHKFPTSSSNLEAKSRLENKPHVNFSYSTRRKTM